MYIITWSESRSMCEVKDNQTHKAMTCSKDAAHALFMSLTKDNRTIEARIRDDAGNLVSGGFYTQA
jgi:hypothetical protein